MRIHYLVSTKRELYVKRNLVFDTDNRVDTFVENMKQDPGSIDAATEWLSSSTGSELLLWFGLSLIQHRIKNASEQHASALKEFLFHIMIQKHDSYSPLILNKLIVVLIELSKKMIPLKLWLAFWKDVTGLRQISNALFLKFILVMIEEFTSSKRDLKWHDKKVITASMMDLIDPCLEICLAILRDSSSSGAEAVITTAQGSSIAANVPIGILGDSPIGQRQSGRAEVQTFKEAPVENLVLKVFLALCQHMNITRSIFPEVLEELFKISIGPNIAHSQLALSCLIELSNNSYTPRGRY